MKIAVYDPLKAFTPFLEHLGKTHEVTWIDIPVSLDELRWQQISNDVMWYEFTDEIFARTTHNPKDCKVINRLHSYELFTDVFGRVNWENVDLLCASSDYVKAMLELKRTQFDFPQIVSLANGPDLDKLVIPEGKEYGKRIAVVGRINYKKNLPLAIYCLDAVRERGYEMHFIGGSQDLRFDLYLKHLIESLKLQDQAFFHGEIKHEEMPEALESMSYILSTSLFESFGQSIMEGIGSGCLPVIHDFPGARERFAGMGNIFFSTPHEFSLVMREYETMQMKNPIAHLNRSTIKKYDLRSQEAVIDKILEDIGGEIESFK